MIKALVLLDIALMLRQLWPFRWEILNRFFVANRSRFRFLLVNNVYIVSIVKIAAFLFLVKLMHSLQNTSAYDMQLLPMQSCILE